MQSHLEIERKWDVAESTPVPELTRLPKVVSVEAPRELSLESVYYDTEEHDLLRAGITLRRRTGGDDEGWHLKLPRDAGEREELQEPLLRGATAHLIPKSLTTLVQVHARGRRLEPVATVRNRRVVHLMLAEDGTVLAELCDDHVRAETPRADDTTSVSTWREWELELLAGSRKLLAAAHELVVDAGARQSAATSKLARAVGAPSPPPRDPEPKTELSKKSPAGVVLKAHLRAQVGILEACDPKVRSDLPDSVHRMRVTTRRLRSALATFAPLLDPAQRRHLRDELKWLADLLGQARDAEVMRDRLVALAAEQSLDPGAGDDAGELGRELDARYRAAHRKVLRGLDSTRYYRLLDGLEAMLSSPPWTSAAAEPAGRSLRGLVRRDWRRLAKRVARARGAQAPAERGVALHEARKAAKRLRYACEALVPVFGDPATDLGGAAKELQEVLGEHQDSLVSQQLLRDLADRAGLHGDDALVLGRLHLLEQQHAARALARFEVVWTEASDKRLRRWLTR